MHDQAFELARQEGQAALEASWLVELGKIAAQEKRYDEADGCAKAALRLAKPLDHRLTVFRAEWLRHRLVKLRDPGQGDRHRLAYVRKLFLQLDRHEGIEEVLEFKRTVMRATDSHDRKKP